ncbi:FAD binding domain-containing protein [Paenibacillus sp. sgz500992]|uniref:FAD binding domain-containing protein n=1 Tax=Paenibacillus sp. sgz500992 TaxID=3242476 RepID=UPI0036D42D81
MGAIWSEKPAPPAVHQPRSLQEAWELKTILGEGAVYVSGGTLLRTQWEAGTAPLPQQMIDLRNIAGMGEIGLAEDYLTIGSLVSLSQCRGNLDLREITPAVQEAARNIAAPAVRNLATLGGNISSGYGDILPALLVYDAEVASFDGKFLSVQPVEAWLKRRWSGEKPAAELLAGIRFPSAGYEHEEWSKLEIFRKVGRRDAFTASLVTIAVAATFDAAGRSLNGVRIAAGGGTSRPQRLPAAEAVLEGAVYSDSLMAAVYEAVESSFDSYSDPFATEAYKRKTAGNLIVSELWKGLNAGGGK